MMRGDAKPIALGAILMLTAGCVGFGSSPMQDAGLSAASIASASAATTASLVTYTLVTTPTPEAPDGVAWTGLGGPIDGFVNPTLRVPHGAPLHVIVRDGDGETHGLGILDSSGRPVAGWAPNVTGFGNETDLRWDLPTPGLYTYECPNATHAMRGFVLVEGGAGVRAPDVPASRPAATPPPAGSGSPHGAQTTEGAVDISGEFTVDATRLTAAPSSSEPLGTIDDPVELSSPPARAHTSWSPDDWVLEVPIRAASNASAPGVFVASLEWDGAFAGEVYFKTNGSAEASGGIVASFALGSQVNTSATYVLKIERMGAGDEASSGPAGSPASSGGSAGPGSVTFSIVSRTDSFSTWVGVGNDTDGKTNPTFHAHVGQIVTLVATEGPTDTETHNLGIRAADKRMVTRWSADIVHPGDTVKLTWRPTAAGTYTYVCKYHDKTQKGSIIVTG